MVRLRARSSAHRAPRDLKPAAVALTGSARPGLQSMSFGFALLLIAQPPLLTALPASLPTPLTNAHYGGSQRHDQRLRPQPAFR